MVQFANFCILNQFQLILFLLLFYSEFHYVSGQYENEHRIRCHDQYCEENSIIPTCPIVKNCTRIGFRKFLNPKVCNCCFYCFDYLEEDDYCRTQSPLPNAICGPSLQCNDNGVDQICETMIGTKGSCSYDLNEYRKRVENGMSGVAEFRPTCGPHGKYSPRQCLPASSICICMNEDGDPIFGLGFAKDRMDCACSRDMERLESFGLLKETQHCLPNGDYDRLQCSLRRRRCYCRLKPTFTVTLGEMADLACYDPKLHPLMYIRPCEHARGELDAHIYAAEVNDSSILIGDFPRCDPDGNYAPIQSKNKKWICVDPEGDQIESYEMPKISSSPLNPPKNLMNCNCARVSNFLGNATTGKPKCCKNGSYRPWQCTGSTCYCVDAIGRQDMTRVPTEVPRDNVSDLSCYFEILRNC